MNNSIIKKLVELFSKFPTIGSRTAKRFVFYLIKIPDREFKEFLKSLSQLREKVKTCIFCNSPFEINNQEEKLCPICRDKTRNQKLLCVVEKESDFLTIEKTKKYNGLYFILGSALSFFKKENNEANLKIEELKKRIKNPSNFILNCPYFEEVIIATNPTPEGESTALFLERKIKEIQMPNNQKPPKVSRLAKGLPSGGELEYADEETLVNAFENRK